MNKLYGYIILLIIFVFLQISLPAAISNEVSITEAGQKDISTGQIDIKFPETAPILRTNEMLNKRQQIIKFITDSENKRQHLRICVQEMNRPIIFKTAQQNINLIDISRGGIALKHNNTLNVGDIIPVDISYSGQSISTKAEIVSTTASRAGAKFINDDKSIENKILYLSILLEADNNMLLTKLSK